MENTILIKNQKNTNSHGYQNEGRFSSNRPSIIVILSNIWPLKQPLITKNKSSPKNQR